MFPKLQQLKVEENPTNNELCLTSLMQALRESSALPTLKRLEITTPVVFCGDRIGNYIRLLGDAELDGLLVRAGFPDYTNFPAPECLQDLLSTLSFFMTAVEALLLKEIHAFVEEYAVADTAYYLVISDKGHDLYNFDGERLKWINPQPRDDWIESHEEDFQ